MRLFVFGFGFTGQALNRRLTSRGWTVSGATRGSDLADVGAEAAAADAVLIAAPPGEQGCPGVSALQDVKLTGWLGYLSSTGVYGDRGGRWAFEDDPPTPLSEEARRRVQTEAAWTGRGAAIFRLPGIYGPGRSVLDRLREGAARRTIRPGQVFSRIHVEDLAAGIEASIRRPNPGRIYNLCDDEPAPAADVTAFGAALLGLEPPPEELVDLDSLSPAARRFWSESKRVSNARAKAELRWRPAYPTYREGLRAILET